jgi:hypothetical protein
MASPAPQRIRPIWLVSYPRSGNTFLRIILKNFFRLPTYSIYNIEDQGFNDPSAQAIQDAPFLPKDWRQRVSDSPQAETCLIKTHGAPEDSAPAIYLIRDGRAALDSYYHYHQQFAFEKPSLTEIIAGACQFGSWSEHFSAWQPMARPASLFLRFEHLVSRPVDLIPQLADFLRVKPNSGRLPTFENLSAQFPAFFRRGHNQDFQSAWTPNQMSLFNHLHGQLMEKLGYKLTPAPEPVGAAAELARSAARLHKLYLENLVKVGQASLTQQQLSQDVTRLSAQVQQLIAQSNEKGLRAAR